MTPSLVYIVQSVPWALGGLLLGFFLGRAIVAADAIADVAADTPTDTTIGDAEPEQGETMSDPARRRRWFNTNTVIVAVIVALGLLTAVQAYVQGEAADRQTEQTRRLADCLRKYSNGIADALDARSTASAAAQSALDALIFAIPTTASDAAGRAKARKAFADYKTLRANSIKTQAAHPFPPAPRDVCQGTG